MASFAFFYVLRWIESAMTFHPARISSEKAAALRPNGAEDVWITTSDDVRLHSWFFKSETSPAIASVIYFHGNGGNLTHRASIAATSG